MKTENFNSEIEGIMPYISILVSGATDNTQ